MYYTYSMLIERYKSAYQIKKALKDKKIVKIKPGFYCDQDQQNLYAELFMKRKDVILTLQSAFSFHEMTDYIPEYIYAATPRNAYPIKSSEIKQVFISRKYHDIGVSEIQMEGYTLKVYDLERSLIELIRYKSKFSFEEYHHVIKNYREKKASLDYHRLQDYAKKFSTYKKIMITIQDSII